MVVFRVIVCSTLLALAATTPVEQCPGQSYENLSDNVQLMPCKKIPCKLRKGTDEHISITFTPQSDLNEVTNHVTADVLGVNLPFVGVDGASICEKIQDENGEKVGCPLKAGTKYVYKDSFPILSFYPSLIVTVRWGLVSKNKDIICFQVAAKIV